MVTSAVLDPLPGIDPLRARQRAARIDVLEESPAKQPRLALVTSKEGHDGAAPLVMRANIAARKRGGRYPLHLLWAEHRPP